MNLSTLGKHFVAKEKAGAFIVFFFRSAQLASTLAQYYRALLAFPEIGALPGRQFVRIGGGKRSMAGRSANATGFFNPPVAKGLRRCAKPMR
jgi:hypothetical protein